MLSRLMYCSDVGDLGPSGVMPMLEMIRKKNQRTFLTGLLLFDQHYFLQCLEGSREQVTATFARIAGDVRHSTVTLMSVTDHDEREYPDWTMGYVSASSPVMSVLRRFSPENEFNPRLLSASAASALLRQLRTLESSVEEAPTGTHNSTGHTRP